jgi:plasmid segregation protein ParM
VSLLTDLARRPERLFDQYAQGLALTAASFFSEYESPLHIVVGLPLAMVQQWQDRLKARLVGFHRVGRASAAEAPVRNHIHIRKVHIVPYPLGTFVNLIMGHDGRMRKTEDGEKKIALIDVGFRTTDLMVMEAARFRQRGSATIEMGLADAWEAIARELGRQGAEMPDMAGLYRAIRMGRLRTEERTYDVAALREKAYRRLAAALADHINHRLRADWDLERLLLTGGAAVELAPNLAPLLDGEVDLIEHEQDVRLSNAQGHLNLARHMWGRSGLCDRAVFT